MGFLRPCGPKQYRPIKFYLSAEISTVVFTGDRQQTGCCCVSDTAEGWKVTVSDTSHGLEVNCGRHEPRATDLAREVFVVITAFSSTC